jgi:phosphatidylserine/phosphatidylglycerophosphate/cardiolipin synthase-like enzyme
MLPGATDSADDPLEQDAPDHPVDDPAIVCWFLGDGDRANRATDLRTFTTGNLVQPLVDGSSYFARLHTELNATEPGDQVYFLDFRGDLDELLDGPGSAVGDVLGRAARRGVKVFGLLWRSQPKALRQSEEGNAEFVREIDEDGGQVLLDARTRRAGSHHQKLVVIRHPGAPGRDVAFVGGIDLGYSRNDDSQHDGDPQVMDFPDSYGPRPPWHDIQAEVRGAAVHDLEHTFRERWYGSSVLDMPSPVRQLYDRAYHMGPMTSRPLPEPVPDESMPRGPHGAGAADLPGPGAPLPVRAARRAEYRACVPEGVRARPLPGLPGGPVLLVAAGGRPDRLGAAGPSRPARHGSGTPVPRQ